MSLIAVDARDAEAEMPHGSGIYVRRLLAALLDHPRTGHTLWPIRHGGRGPEVRFEQLELPWRLRRGRAALLHGPDSFLPLTRSCPAVLTVHDLAFATLRGDMPARTEAKYRLLVPAAARSAQRIICPSEFTAREVEARWRIDRAKLRVIPEAAALAHGELEPPSGPYLLAAGDLRPKKNLGVLIQAFKRLHADGHPHRLILAGADLGQAGALRSLAGRAPVQLTGFVSDAELDALIRGAEVVVVPGFHEGFGLVALDAMTRGRPTVLARAGALPEVGDEAVEYFDPWDVGELTAVLDGLLGSPQHRARQSVAAAERATAFSWKAAAAATWDVYEELL